MMPADRREYGNRHGLLYKRGVHGIEQTAHQPLLTIEAHMCSSSNIK